MRIQDGNCACTCDGINEDARGAIPRNNLLGLSKSCLGADATPNNVHVSCQQLALNRNSTDLSKLQ